MANKYQANIVKKYGMKKNKIVDIVEIIHKKIKVLVKIDYIENEISLVEKHKGIHIHKRWLFAGRGVECMNGWLNILEAQKVAIKEAKRMYEEELARVSAFKDKEVLEMHVASSENKKNINYNEQEWDKKYGKF